ncbi:INO80 complex subunit B, partial [Dispira simplex]
MPSHRIDYSSDNDMDVSTTPSKRSTRLSNRNQHSTTTPDPSTASSPRPSIRSTSTRRLTRARVSDDTSHDPSPRSSTSTRRQRTTRSSASSSNASSPEKVAPTPTRQTTPRKPTATTPRRASSRLRPNADKDEFTSEEGESENSAPLRKANHHGTSLALESSDDAAEEDEIMGVQHTESETGEGKSVRMETDEDEAEQEDVDMDEEEEAEDLIEEGEEEEGEDDNVNEEEEEIFSSDEESFGIMQPSSQPLTKRQRAKLTGGMEEELLELPQESKRRVMTEDEIALKRSENTRRRKFQTMKKLEQEQMDTINRLLKKQASKRSRKDEMDQ